MKMTRKYVFLLMTGVLLSIISSCATVGKNFPSRHVADIKIGEFTKADIREEYGSPWRKGIEDGNETWTYGYYHYKLIGRTSTKDLVIRFDEKGRVTSYSFNESTGGKK